MREAAESGTVVPFERNAPDRDEYEQAVQLWCQSWNVADALSKEEIGALDMKPRMDAQRKALILGFARYLRAHPRADVALGVYLVTTLLSDNDKGTATVSQPTLAKLFQRSVSSIGDAQRRLKEDGLIVTGRGRYAGASPVIPRFTTTTYNHMTWLVSAICNADETPKLPAPPVDCQSTGPTGGLLQSLGGTGGLNSVNQPVEDVSINRPDRCQLLSKTSREDTTLDSARDARSLTRAVAIGIAAATASLPAAAAPVEPPAIIQPAKPSHIEMVDRMLDTAGRCLKSPAIRTNLLLAPELKSWLQNGCDFEQDILPVIQALSAGKPPASVNTWGYFSDAIAENLAKRTAPMPAPALRPPKERLAPWEEEALRVKLEADAVSEQYKAEYRRKMEQSRG